MRAIALDLRSRGVAPSQRNHCGAPLCGGKYKTKTPEKELRNRNNM
jgi:hypothetical protein